MARTTHWFAMKVRSIRAIRRTWFGTAPKLGLPARVLGNRCAAFLRKRRRWQDHVRAKKRPLECQLAAGQLSACGREPFLCTNATSFKRPFLGSNSALAH